MPKRTAKNRTIEVILLDSDKHLGEKFEVVRVTPIFAKNVLLPKQKAVLATPANLHSYQQKMAAAEAQRAKKAKSFEDMMQKIQQDGGIKIEKNTNEKGVLYSKIDAKEVAQLLSDTYSLKVEDHYLKLKKKITRSGEFLVPFQYGEFEKDVLLVVKGNVTKQKKVLSSMGVIKKAEPVEEGEAEKKTEETTEDKAE